jgi:hypothetical protein
LWVGESSVFQPGEIRDWGNRNAGAIGWDDRFETGDFTGMCPGVTWGLALEKNKNASLV